mmetsp:Transcript_137601/g.343417  ORF Transcript_137601/g.343417 Transcript_137601/m.343417 type:complete len:418 (-) Transcript_137601:396-1649(-)
MRVVVVPGRVEIHSAPAVHPPVSLAPLAFFPTSLVLRSGVANRLGEHLPARPKGVAHGPRALLEAASAVDSALLTGTVDVPMLLVGGLVVWVEVQLDRGDLEVVHVLGMSHQGANSLPSVALSVIALEDAHDRIGCLVSFLVGQEELAARFPDTTLWCVHCRVHKRLEEPLVRRHTRRRHAIKCALDHAVKHIANFSRLGLARIAMAFRRGAAWVDIITCGVGWACDTLPLHQLAQFLVTQEAALWHFDRLEEPAGLINERRLHLPHLRPTDLREQARVALLLHGMKKRLLLRETGQLFFLCPPDEHRHFRTPAWAYRRLHDCAVPLGSQATAGIQFANSLRHHALLPMLCGHEVHSLGRTGAEHTPRGLASRTAGARLDLDPKGDRRHASDAEVSHDGPRAPKLHDRRLVFGQGRR